MLETLLRRDTAEADNDHKRRPLAVVATSLVAVAGLVLTACSDDGEEQGGEASGDSDFETITIEHALGTAEITEKPERVVALGQGSAETAIALGIIPVAMEEYPWGADESGYLPWVKEAVEEQGAELPDLIKGDAELSAEEVLSYEPDVILAPFSGITQEQYDQLAEIAPTVAYPEVVWTIRWDEQIETVAKALGEEDRVDELLADIDKEFEEAEEPEYSEHTFSFIYNQGPDTYGIMMPTEQRAEFVTKMGLPIDPVVEEFKDKVTEGTDSAPLSPENLDKLHDSDLIFTFYSTPELREELHNDPAYSRIPAIAQGAEVAPEDQSVVTASSLINPLTVPWVMDTYKELINEAISNVEK